MLDARDPLRYRSEDLEAFARETHPAKASLMLLNKADLLPQQLRAAWAAYFRERGVDFIFWSAKAASEQTGGQALQSPQAPLHDVPRTPHNDNLATSMGSDHAVPLYHISAEGFGAGLRR